MVVYLDIIFLENVILNIIILSATLIVLKRRIIWKQVLAASLVGSIYTLFYYVFPNSIFSSWIMKILLSILMVAISFKIKNFSGLIESTMFFYLISFIFGGVSFLVVSKNYGFFTLGIGVLMAFIIVIVSFRLYRYKFKFKNKNFLCNIVIKIEQKKLNVKAMIDTGNLLKDPITDLPVIIVEREILYNILPNSILDNIDNILGGDLEKISQDIRDEYISKLKIIPFSSLGKQNGILLGIKTGGLKIERGETVTKIDDVVMGIYNKRLSKKREFNALIGINLV